MLGRSKKPTFLHKNKPKIAYRRPPNLKDILINADISLKNRETKKVIGMKGQTDPVTTPPKLDENKLRQTSITDFIKSIPPTTSSNTAGNAMDNLNTFTARSEKKGRQKHHKNCYKPNCKYCPYLDKSGSITCHFNGQTYFCKENVTCQSSNLIYGIGCKRCGKHYVGETKRPIHMRLSEHLRGIRNCQLTRDT